MFLCTHMNGLYLFEFVCTEEALWCERNEKISCVLLICRWHLTGRRHTDDTDAEMQNMENIPHLSDAENLNRFSLQVNSCHISPSLMYSCNTNTVFPLSFVTQTHIQRKMPSLSSVFFIFIFGKNRELRPDQTIVVATFCSFSYKIEMIQWKCYFENSNPIISIFYAQIRRMALYGNNVKCVWRHFATRRKHRANEEGQKNGNGTGIVCLWKSQRDGGERTKKAAFLAIFICVRRAMLFCVNAYLFVSYRVSLIIANKLSHNLSFCTT